MDISDLPDVWNICDDGDGIVDMDEFIDGLAKRQLLLLRGIFEDGFLL